VTSGLLLKRIFYLPREKLFPGFLLVPAWQKIPEAWPENSRIAFLYAASQILSGFSVHVNLCCNIFVS